MTTKLPILFFASNPEDVTQLNLDEEIRSITTKIRASEYRDVLDLVSRWAIRPDDLLQELNTHKPTIVHFSGHGSKAGELILMNDLRQAKTVSPSALKALFSTLKDNIRLVVLNACYSKKQADAIADVIDCVVGMNASIGDKAAIIFAASFYRAIGFGRSVKESFEQGKVSLMLEGIPEENTPELLTRRNIDPSRLYLVIPHSSLEKPEVLQLKKRIDQLSEDERKQFDLLDEHNQARDDIEGSAAETYYRTANVFFVTNKYFEALELYDKAINLRPSWIKPYLLKGMVFERLGEWDKALEVYRLADRLSGHDQLALASSLLNLACTNSVLGNFRETVLLCDRVMSLIPLEHSPPYIQQAARFAASAYQQMGNTKKEAEYLMRFIEATDRNSEQYAAAKRRLEEIRRV